MDNTCLVLGNFESKWFDDSVEIPSAEPHLPDYRFQRPWAVNTTISLKKNGFPRKTLREDKFTALFDSGFIGAFGIKDKATYLAYITLLSAHFRVTISSKDLKNRYPSVICPPELITNDSVYFEISVSSSFLKTVTFQLFPKDFIEPVEDEEMLCVLHIKQFSYPGYSNNIMIGAPFFKKYFVGYNYEEYKVILGKTKENEKIC